MGPGVEHRQLLGVGEARSDLHQAEPEAHEIAQHPAEQHAEDADDGGFEHEDAADQRLAQAERLHDGDVARLLVGDRRHDVEGAEGGNEQDGADHHEHDDVADLEGREQVLVRLLPRDGLVAGLGLDALGDRPGLQRIVDPNAQLVHETGLAGQDLGGPHQRVGLAFVDLPHARVEQTHHLGQNRAPVPRRHRHGIADAHADARRECVSEDDGVRRPVQALECSHAHLHGELRDLRLAARINADHRGGGVATIVAQDRLGLGRRCDRAGDPALQRGQDGQRVLDAAPFCLRRQAVDLDRIEQRHGGLVRRFAALVRDADMRQAVDQLADEVALRPLHQRSHHHRKADPRGDAKHPDQGLPDTGPDMLEGDVEGETHLTAPAVRGGRGRPAGTRCAPATRHDRPRRGRTRSRPCGCRGCLW